MRNIRSIRILVVASRIVQTAFVPRRVEMRVRVLEEIGQNFCFAELGEPLAENTKGRGVEADWGGW